MPLVYDIDPSRRLVTLRPEGYPPPDEWFATITKAVADPRFAPGFDFLYDRSGVDHIPDAMYVRAWVFRHAAMMKEVDGGRLAVVVTQPVVYGMIRMASAFADSAGVRVDAFWTEAEALRWLGHDSAASVA